MKYFECEIPEETGYLIPISDLHLGDKAFTKDSEKKLKGYLDWVDEHPNSRIILMGDIFNTATRESLTSPFEQTSGEFQRAIDIFTPYKDKIITAIPGNHEHRLINFADVNLIQMFCLNLGIPYGTTSCVIRFKIGKRDTKNNDNRFLQNYFGYFHHSKGGGGSVGSKLNVATKLRNVVEGMDFYAVGHNHGIATAPVSVFRPSLQGRVLKKSKIWFINTGSYLEYIDSYAEEGMMAPGKLGSVRIRFDSKSHDMHVSL